MSGKTVDFRLGIMQNSGILVRADKRFVKEAMLLVMEDLRCIARVRGLDVVYGIATSLFEWQLVRYELDKEIRMESTGFEVS